jgi:hypothetical protein
MFDIFHGILFPESFHQWVLDREQNPENLEVFRRREQERLTGYTGQQFMEAGLSRAILTRYQTLIVRPEFYGTIIVSSV